MMAPYRAVPRFLVWAGLAALSLYIGIRLATGSGRDIEFSQLTWTTAAVIQTLVLTAVLAGLFVRAAWLTWRNELAASPPGIVHVPGAPLNTFADAFLSIVGGLLIAVAVFLLLHIPEAILAGNSELYRGYHSASPTPNIVISVIMVACGWPLLVVRRYVWELRVGQPIRRSWARAFSRGKPLSRDIRLYWTYFYEKQYMRRVPVARWLRAEDPRKAGFFKDAHLELAPLDASYEQLAAMTQAWQARFTQLAGSHHVISLDPVERPGAVI